MYASLIRKGLFAAVAAGLLSGNVAEAQDGSDPFPNGGESRLVESATIS